jgi:hypothetical protein
MNKLLALVVLLTGCYAKTPPLEISVGPCHVEDGRYIIYARGEIPSDPKLHEHLCPTERFIDFRHEIVTHLSELDEVYYCGPHEATIGPAYSYLMTTKEGISGYQTVKVAAIDAATGWKTFCFAYIRITYKRIGSQREGK